MNEPPFTFTTDPSQTTVLSMAQKSDEIVGLTAPLSTGNLNMLRNCLSVDHMLYIEQGRLTSLTSHPAQQLSRANK